MPKYKNEMKIKKEFYRITRLLPVHRSNYLEDREIRKDIIFDLLAEKVFDYPELLDILYKKIRKWLIQEKSEFTYCLAGYIYYLKEDFAKATKYFLNAIQENPRNLDNWFDLAFSLYHQDYESYNLGKFILFHYLNIIKFFEKKRNISIKNLKAFTLKMSRSL